MRAFRVPLELIGLLEGKDVLVGAIDVATDRVETPEEVAGVIRAALRFVPADRLLPCTNCGMVPLARDVARGKLRAPGSRDRPGSPGIDVLNGPGRVDRASGRMPRLARDSAQQENACQAETYRFTAEITV